MISVFWLRILEFWSIFLHLVPKLWQIDKYQGHREATHMDENQGQMEEGVSVQIAEQKLMFNA